MTIQLRSRSRRLSQREGGGVVFRLLGFNIGRGHRRARIF